jgi:hypothetical protein
MTILDRLRHLLSCSICVCVSATVFRRLCLHLCCSSSRLCCSICVRIGVAASVFQLLFSIHNRLPSMTTLIICVISVVAIFPTEAGTESRFSSANQQDHQHIVESDSFTHWVDHWIRGFTSGLLGAHALCSAVLECTKF